MLTLLLLASLQAPIAENGSTPRVGLSWRSEVDEPFAFDVGAYVRVAFPIGALQDGDTVILQGPGGTTTILYEDRLRYRELFDPGLGVTLEAAVLFIHPEGRRGGGSGFKPVIGAYLSLQADDFNGDSATDQFGNRLEADDMLIYSAIAGIKAAQTIQKDMVGDVRVGFGLARFEEVEGEFNPAGGTTVKGTLIDSTETYVFEIRGHGVWRLGPVALTFGGGFRIFGQPDGSHAAGVLGFDPDALFTIDLEAGLELGF